MHFQMHKADFVWCSFYSKLIDPFHHWKDHELLVCKWTQCCASLWKMQCQTKLQPFEIWWLQIKISVLFQSVVQPYVFFLILLYSYCLSVNSWNRRGFTSHYLGNPAGKRPSNYLLWYSYLTSSFSRFGETCHSAGSPE